MPRRTVLEELYDFQASEPDCRTCRRFVVALLIASAAQQNTPSESASKDNDELREIYQADQAARENLIGTVGNEAVTTLMNADRMRRARVLEIYTGRGLNTGADYYHAAMVLQHGEAATIRCWLMNSQWRRLVSVTREPSRSPRGQKIVTCEGLDALNGSGRNSAVLAASPDPGRSIQLKRVSPTHCGRS